MPELVEPDAGCHAAWLASHREWGPGLHEDGFGIGQNDDVESSAGFAAWVARTRSRPGRLWWIVEQQVVLGGIVLRPPTNADVLSTGHIGFGVRPSARGRGLATWALSQVLGHAREAGRDRVLLVCRDDNEASVRTIERCGGVFDETLHDGHDKVRRYWITL